jgi:hypothetical protein
MEREYLLTEHEVQTPKRATTKHMLQLKLTGLADNQHPSSYMILKPNKLHTAKSAQCPPHVITT